MKSFLKCSLVFIAFSSVILSGCKKDVLSGISQEQSASAIRNVASAERRPDLVVHTGQSIQAAVNSGRSNCCRRWFYHSNRTGYLQRGNCSE